MQPGYFPQAGPFPVMQTPATAAPQAGSFGGKSAGPAYGSHYTSSGYDAAGGQLDYGKSYQSQPKANLGTSDLYGKQSSNKGYDKMGYQGNQNPNAFMGQNYANQAGQYMVQGVNMTGQDGSASTGNTGLTSVGQNHGGRSGGTAASGQSKPYGGQSYGQSNNSRWS